jgi:steroid delta-isomerase-like uncharacterized protein
MKTRIEAWMKARTDARTVGVAALALGLALAAGCKKKEPPQDRPAPAGSGSAPAAATGSAGSAPTPPPAAPAPKTGKDLAQVLLDCGELINAAKWEAFGQQCAAPGFITHQAGDRDLTRDQLVPQLAEAKVAFPDIRVAPQLLLVNGRSVASVVLMKGTNDGPLKGEAGTLPATKQKMGVLLYERFAMTDENQASERWAYVDPGTMLGQLGHRLKGAQPVRPALEQGLPGAPVIAVAAGDAKEQANLAVVRRGIEAFNGRKLADLMAGYADGIVESDQAAGANVTGKPAIEQGLQRLWKAFSDGKLEVPVLWAAGDYVVAEGTLTGTHDGPLAGPAGTLPKTGKPIAMSYAEIFKLEGGKVVELWRFRNDLALMQQLGMGGPPPPAQGAPPPPKP